MSDRLGSVDVVYTWVDDSFDGYLEQLTAHADDPRDTNPNRTRDNLEILRYSLRSLHRFLPELGQIYLLTCRPQVPPWLNLDHPGITVVHHDEVIAPEHLPTFNSFCIVSHLHKLPGLSRQFLYFEDDMLLLRPGLMAALAPGGDGSPLAFFSHEPTGPMEKLRVEKASPWDLALARSDEALARQFRAERRKHIIHGPLLIDRDEYGAVIDCFGAEIAATRQSKFRSADCVAPEYLYPHAMVADGKARTASRTEVRRVEGFVSLSNLVPWTWAQFAWLGWKTPISATLNDSFDDRPNPRAEALVRRWLETRFPDPSPWELA